MPFFENLTIWKEARILVNDIYRLHNSSKDFGFKDQIQRASVSVMNNISEGAECGSDATFIRYLRIAKASCAEVRSMLYLSEDFNICNIDEAEELRNKSTKISSGIYHLIQHLKKTS